MFHIMIHLQVKGIPTLAKQTSLAITLKEFVVCTIPLSKLPIRMERKM